MNYVLILGPPAVGKATIAAEVARLTGYRLVLNTLTAEMLLNVFQRSERPFGPLHVQFQQRILEEAAKAGISIVSTLAWAFSDELDWKVSRARIEAVRELGGRTCIAELEAPLETRIERNHLPDRIDAKPNQAATLTDQVMRDLDGRYRLNSEPGELEGLGDYLRLDTTLHPANRSAALIVEHFGLPRIG